MSASGIFDFGVGYQFNSWLRGDVTEEFRGGAHFQALEVLTEPNTFGAFGKQQYADFYRADLASYVTMFNAYADLGTWYGSRPMSARASVSRTTGCLASPTPARRTSRPP